MASALRICAIRNFSINQVLACKPYRPTPIVPTIKEGGYKIWKKISLFVMMPLIGLLMVKCVLYGPKKGPRPEFIPYEHLRLRAKRFAWGDGNKSLFHHPIKNALPDGYEEDDDYVDECAMAS